MTKPFAERMAAMKIYEDLIGVALTNRGQQPGDWQPHRTHRGRACYEVRMCEQLLSTLHSRGRVGVSLQDVFRQARCAAGHVDYQHKLALYCAFLEEDSVHTQGGALAA